MDNYIYYYIDSIVAINLLLLSVASLMKKGYKTPVNRLFASFCSAAILWIIFGDTGNDVRIPMEIALWANYISLALGIAMATFIMQFVMKLVDDSKLNIIVRRSSWFFWAVCIISGLPGAVASSIINQDGIYGIIWGPFVWLYVVGLLSIFSLMTYGMIYGLRHAVGIKKRQLIATVVGVVGTVPMVVMLSFAIPLITGIFWFNYFSATPALFLVFSVYYGVIRYHLFDIRSAAVRTLAYILSLGVLIIIYYALATVISGLFMDSNMATNQSPLSIGLALGLLFIFQPVKRFFDRLTNNLFYRDNYDSDEFFARFNRLLTSTIDLRYLLERTATEIATTLKSEQAFFYIHTRDGHYITAGTPHHRQLSLADSKIIHNLIHGKISTIIVASLLNEDDPIRHVMVSNHIEIIMPLVQADTLGHLCIGDHRTSHYTNRDIKVLNTVADGLVIAIQNTLSIQEIRNINAANLQRRIADATKELRTSNALLRQIDEEKDEFVSVASHELRTPMTVIRGYISLLERGQLGSLNDAQKAILEKMSANTKTLIDLVNNMLDLSKLESNKLEMTITKNSLSTLTQASIDKMKLLFAGKGVALSYDGHDATINTDAEKFDRILVNLLSNAYKFTPGGGKVTVTTTINQTDHLATVCVADTGIGIPKDGRDNLFKKFSQVDNYLQRQSGGTGLGLSICKGLVEKLGGKIWVDSTAGQGSEFYFTVEIS